MSSPFYIFVDVFRFDGTRATVSDTSVIRAFDEEQSTLTFLGEHNVTEVGRQQVFFTHAPHQYPNGRLLPNVQLQLFSSTPLLVHTTSIFNELPLGSIIKVVLGVGDSVLGVWIVSGTVTDADTSDPITVGEVEVLQVVGSAITSLGATAVDENGDYTFTVDEQFVPIMLPPQPTFMARYRDEQNVIRAQSDPITATGQSVVINLAVEAETEIPEGPKEPQQHVVRGVVKNGVGAVFPGMTVEACQVIWNNGTILTPALAPRVQTDEQGRYEIVYQPVPPPECPADCCRPGEFTLMVRVVEGTSTESDEIVRSPLISPVQLVEEVDLVIDAIADVTDPEFARIDRAYRKCTPENEPRPESLYRIRDEAGYLEFAARSLLLEREQLLAYVNALLIARDINSAIAFGSGELEEYDPFPAEILFALTRQGLGDRLTDLLRLESPEFLKAVIEAMNRGLIDPSYENRLSLDAEQSLSKQWSLVRAHFLSASVSQPFRTDEAELLELVFTNATQRAKVAELQIEHRGSFADFVEALRSDDVIDDQEAEDLLFVFEVYETAGQHLPIVKVLYSHKEDRGWHKASDLSTVTRRAENDVDGWDELASQQTGPQPFPEDIFGRSDAEKAVAHGRRLHEAFSQEYHQARFVNEVAQFAVDASDQAMEEAVGFLNGHPDFNLEETPIYKYLRENDLTVPDDLSEEGLEKLKQLQRLRRLTPEFGEAKLLIDANYDSAVAIAQVDEHQFIADMEEAFDGDLGKVRAIHRKAKQYATEVLGMVLRFQDQLNDTGGISSLGGFVTLMDSFTETHGDEPRFARYAALFGDLFSCASRHCQTVLSPAAYLVDLLQFTEGASRNLLLERRPDLTELELNCENTNTVQPYIDLVIERLSAIVEPWEVPLVVDDGENPPEPITAEDLDTAAGVTDEEDENGEDDEARRAAVAKIVGIIAKKFRVTARASVRKTKEDTENDDGDEWVIEDDGFRWRVVAAASEHDPAEFIARGTPQTGKNAELLDVFPEHENVPAETVLGETVFPFHLPLALGRREVELILRQRGLSRAEVLAAFPQDLPEELSPPDALHLVEDGEQARAYLSLTSHEEGAILSSAEEAHEYWGFTGDGMESVPRPEAPQNVITASWIRLLSEVSIFLHRTQLTYAQLLDLVATEFIHSDAPVVIVEGADDEESETGENASECNYNRYRLLNLNEDVLRRISFFVRLWRKVGWDMHTLDRYLMLFELDRIESEEEERTPPPDLGRLARFQQVAERLSLKPMELFSFLGDLDLTRSERLGPSVFEQLLLKGPRNSFGYQLIGKVAAGQSEEDTKVEDEAELESLQATLRSALNLPRPDLLALWDEVMPATLPFSPTVEQLSSFTRIAIFCRAQGISVPEYLRAKELLGIDPFAGEDEDEKLFATARAISQLTVLRAAGLSLALVDYLLSPPDPDVHALVPTTETLDEVRRLLCDAAKAVEQRYPPLLDPDAEVLTTLLAEVMPEEKILTVLEVLANPTMEGGEERLARYFEAFLGEETESFIEDLLDEGEPEPEEDEEAAFAARVEKVVERLRLFLVERERHQQALTVATAVMGLQRSTLDYLLTVALSSTADGSEEKALADWMVSLGAFDVRFERFDEALDSGEWSSHWVAAADAEVRFVATFDSEDPVAATLEIDGEALAMEAAGSVLTFGPLAVRAGEVHSFRFSTASTAELRLQVRINNGEPAPLPVSWFTSFGRDVFVKLQKAALLVTGARLDPVELKALVWEDEAAKAEEEEPLLDGFPVSGGQSVPWERLRGFLRRLSLHRSLRLEESSLFEVLHSDEELEVADVARLTGWDEEDVTTALDKLWADQVEPSFHDAETWRVLDRAMAAAARLEISVKRAIELLVESEPTTAVARLLREELRAKFTTDAFVSAFKPARDELRQAHRDALVGYLTSREIEVGGETRFFVNANDLFGYFLIDVEMEPDTQISRIVLALNSIQLFVQRVFLGLETKTALRRLEQKKEQWQWMQNYRVWEANRKVFLYPENWIEPQLRDDKSELFKELEEELLQDDIDDKKAQGVLARYVDKLQELSQLTIVGMHDAGPRMYLIGRDRAQPYAYYYRSIRTSGRGVGLGLYAPWVKIPLEIEAGFAAPVESAGKLWIFWTLLQEKQKVETGDEAEDLGTLVTIQLMWSTLDPVTGEWSKPRLSKSKVIDRDPTTVFEKATEDDGPETQFYHLRVQPAGGGGVQVEVIKSSRGGSTLLGKIRISPQGEDTAQEDGRKLRFGDYFPGNGTLRNNGAHEFTTSAGKLLRLNGIPYFQRLPAPFEGFRLTASDLNYFPTNSKTPFVYELGSTKLMGSVNRVYPRDGGGVRANRNIRFDTIGHPVMNEIAHRLRMNGAEGIMNRLTQALPTSKSRTVYSYRTVGASAYQSGTSYQSGYTSYGGGVYLGYYRAGDTMARGTIQREFKFDFKPASLVLKDYPKPTVEFDYGTAFGVYNWELFFHLPMLVADRLSQEMRFDEALKWVHYVFDPRQDLNSYERTKRWVEKLGAGCRYWNFLPFFANKEARNSLTQILRGDENEDSSEELRRIIQDWRNDPFNPHLIARQRIAAYQKFTVMKYLDILIAWGDQLFRQDSFEAINQATQLYVLAAELLGERPEVIEPVGEEPRMSYRDLQTRGIDDFSNALVELEVLAVGSSVLVSEQSLPEAHADTNIVQDAAISSLFFRVPRNDRLEGYWDTVADRLFKIRNSMNIDGVKRTLALFQPPIDPAMLVRAAAAGVDLSSALSQLSRPLPHYRFAVWVNQAKELANELKSFSAALLSALEKKDAEELALIRQDHEVRLLSRITEVRKEQIREAEQNLVALRERRALPLDRIEDLSNRAFINASEDANMSLTRTARDLDIAGGVMNTLAGALSGVPQAEVGAFSASISIGGLHLGNIFSALGTALGTVSGTLRTEAGLAATLGGFERRQEDWDLQIRQAELELKEIDQQIIAAEIRVELAKKELENHEVQVEQAQEVREFLQDKYTNRELYQWMITQLSKTYQQAYRLAYDVAKTAERCFAFELGTEPPNFVQFDYRDSLHQGLLSGEKLFLDLKRMEVAYFERDKREFEITKPISLEHINPYALQELRETGACEFELPEILFDLDFPGQYFRRIRAVRLTIPAVTGPYTNVSAKLSLLQSAIRVKSTADPAKYAYEGLDDSRFLHDTRGIQSIATSSAQDDAGLFELNFRDERYLPFEGAGAVSRWRLELPETGRQFDYSSISDVVMHLSYTARDAGGSLKKGAQDNIKDSLNNILRIVSDSSGLVRVFSLKREFPDALHQLLTGGTTTIDLRPEHFPHVLWDLGYTLKPKDDSELITVHVETKGAIADGTLSLALNEGDPGDAAELGGGPDPKFITGSLERELQPLFHESKEQWTLEQENLSLDNVEDILFVLRYEIE